MKYILLIAALVACWLAVGLLEDELSALVDVRRVEAEALLVEAQAERTLAAAQLEQAQALKLMAEAQRAQAGSVVMLAALLAVWSLVIGAGGVAVAVIALRPGKSALVLPPAYHREALPQPRSLSWPVQRPIEIYQEEARRG